MYVNNGLEAECVSDLVLSPTVESYDCILTIDHAEIILVDTPGLHKCNQELNKRLNQQAIEGTDGADLNFLLIDLSQNVMQQFSNFKANVEKELGRTWVIFTKSDKTIIVCPNITIVILELLQSR